MIQEKIITFHEMERGSNKSEWAYKNILTSLYEQEVLYTVISKPTLREGKGAVFVGKNHLNHDPTLYLFSTQAYAEAFAFCNSDMFVEKGKPLVAAWPTDNLHEGLVHFTYSGGRFVVLDEGGEHLFLLIGDLINACPQKDPLFAQNDIRFLNMLQHSCKQPVVLWLDNLNLLTRDRAAGTLSSLGGVIWGLGVPFFRTVALDDSSILFNNTPILAVHPKNVDMMMKTYKEHGAEWVYLNLKRVEQSTRIDSANNFQQQLFTRNHLPILTVVS